MRIFALIFILSSCNSIELPQQSGDFTSEFQAIPNEKSNILSEFNPIDIETRASANSIGTGPYSRALISSSSNFNYAKITMILPKIDPENLLADARRYCEIKKINSKVVSGVISRKISRQIPYVYTGFTDLDIGVLYN